MEGRDDGSQFVILSMRKPGGAYLEDSVERQFRFERCMTKGARERLFDVAEVCATYSGDAGTNS